MAIAKHNVEIGHVYGDLTVTATGLRAEPTPSQRERRCPGERAVLCRCVCGVERVVKIGYLVRGRVTSCGCKPQPMRKSPAKDAVDGASESPTPSVERAPSAPKRVGRQPKEIDTSSFAGVMSEALVAFRIDSGYAERMLHNANLIMRKRESWVVRNELRAAESAARTACAASDLTSCEVQNPCGTGSGCPWAAPEFARIDAPAIAATVHKATARSTRPQPRTGDGYTYTIESALPLILAERARSAV
jgi:hypothetical protein